jgi:PAS domain S-box-containing protein
MKQQIGRRLRLTRELAGMSHTEAAARIGVTREHLFLLERGGSYPSLGMLVRAATAYQTELVNFFLFSPDDPAPEGKLADKGSPEEKPPENCLPEARLPDGAIRDPAPGHQAEPRLVSGCGVWTMDFATGRDSWSRGLCRMLGCSERTLPGDPAFLRMVQPEESARIKRFLTRIRDRKRVAATTCGILLQGGALRRLLILADQLEDESDIPDQARLVLLDVTDWEELRSLFGRNKAQLTRMVDDKTSALRQAAAEARRELRQRMVAEDVAKRQKVQLQQILAAIPAVVYSFSPGHGLKEWHSPHIQAILGVSRRELLEHPGLWDDAVHPDDRPVIAAALERARQGRPVDLEYRIKGADGSWHRLHDRATPFRDGSDELLLAGVAVDITERTRAEEALRKSEENYRRLFETMRQGVIMYQSSNGAIISANPSAERILGLTLAQMQGRSITDPKWRIIKEDGTELCEAEHPVSVALRTGKSVGYVTLGLYPPGRENPIWLSITAIPLFEPGESQPYQVYSTFEDITLRKQAEARYQALIDAQSAASSGEFPSI